MFALARQAGVGITADGIYGVATALRPDSSSLLLELASAGELRPDVTLIHGTGFSDSVFQAIATHGVSLVLAPTSDATLRGLADSVTPIQGVIDHDLLQRTGLSVDVEVSLSTDLFAQMRAVFLVQRVLSNKRWFEKAPSPSAPITVRQVLTLATIGGARASGLLNRIGTLTPGKDADIVMIRGNDIATGPLNSALGTVVIGAGPDNVDTVIVRGRLKKWRGKMVGIDEAGIMQKAQASRDFLARATGLWQPPKIVGD